MVMRRPERVWTAPIPRGRLEANGARREVAEFGRLVGGVPALHYALEAAHRLAVELSDQRDVLDGCHKRAYKIENA
jgi:hypothetical protein